MKLEQFENSLLFSTTSIPDAFFTEYYSQASSDAIKVFLYLYFLSKYGKEIKINDLSKKLNLPLKSIQDSIKYWEGLGLLIRKNSGYAFANMQEMELYKLYTPKVTQTPDQIKNTEKNQYRAKAIESINNEFFQGVMSPSWYGDIDFGLVNTHLTKKLWYLYSDIVSIVLLCIEITFKQLQKLGLKMV